MTEEEVAAYVVAFWEERGFDVYQEVGLGHVRCDVVAVQGPLLVAVEVKLSYTFKLLEQCENWLNYANRVYAAVPVRPSTTFATRLASSFGIGLMRVYQGQPRITIDAPLRRKVLPDLRDALMPEHKTFASAGTSGAFWTPFKATCGRLREYVLKNQGALYKDVIKQIDHHYASDASAKQSLRKWIEKGTIQGLRLERDGRDLRVYADPIDGQPYPVGRRRR